MYRTNEKLKQCISTPIQPGGRRQGSSFIHYQTVGYKSKLKAHCIIVIVINNNTHSSGVSLQQTKERKLLYPKINFFCENRNNFF